MWGEYNYGAKRKLGCTDSQDSKALVIVLKVILE